jgi:polyvinyl alcohol dehydrogenase (cytochrome)
LKVWLVLCALGLATPALAQAPAAPAPSGAAVFDNNCATCHAVNDDRVPTVAALRERPPEFILSALTTGVMRQQGGELTEAQRRAVAEFLAGRPLAAVSASNAGRCANPSTFDPAQGSMWAGWGPDSTNARFQSAAQAGITADVVPKLTLKWAFGFPNATSARSQPTVAGGRLFVGGPDGTVYALDARTGCTIWTFKAKAGVRTAIVVGAPAGASTPLYFGDGRSNVYALNASTGEQLWTQNIETHPSSHVTGAPALYQNRLYVSVASGEEGQGGSTSYECCTFRGSMVALNIANGGVVWKTYTIPEEPRTLGRNAGGSVRWGPSGAGIWASPTVDPKRRLVYGATGNMYTEPQQGSSDAVIAFEMDTGKIAWTSQVTPKDVFVVGCNQPNPANCPVGDDVGPDFDFGNSPMLVSLPGGRDLIVIGQKSGVGWALDPDKKGAVVWQYRAGQGSALGGMEFGSATDGVNAYFPVNDLNMPTAGELHAVRLDTGEPAWKAPPQVVVCGARGRGCTPGIQAPITVIPGVIFVGSMDGGVRGYSTKDGSILWSFNTNIDFTTVNGVPAKGASINGAGPAVVGGMVYVNSGYGSLGGRPGNVLLAFGIE